MANAYGVSPQKRMIVGLVIIGMHVVFYIALKSGLARAGLEIVAEAVNIDLPPPPPKPEELKEPPPPPPQDIPPPMVPPPMIDLAPDTGPSNAITNVVVADQPQRAAAPVAPQRQVVRTNPGFRARPDRIGAAINSCYPSASRRLNEEGRVLVDVTVGADGKVSRVNVGQSSGFERLDGAAECVVRKIPFNPGTVDGAPIEATVRIPISFRLENQ